MRRHLPRQSGFTLGETLAILAIAGVTLSVALPSLGELAQADGEAAAVNRLVGSIHQARSTAVTRNRAVSLCPSRDGGRCSDTGWDLGWIVFLDRDTDGVRDPDEDLLDLQPATTGLRITADRYADGLGYGPTGRLLPGTGGRFSICAVDATQPDRLVVMRGNGLPAVAAADDTSRCPAD